MQHGVSDCVISHRAAHTYFMNQCLGCFFSREREDWLCAGEPKQVLSIVHHGFVSPLPRAQPLIVSLLSVQLVF